MNPIAKLMLLTVFVAANIIIVVPPPPRPARASRAVGAGISCLLALKRGITAGDPMGLLAPWKRDGLQAPPAATPRHLGGHRVEELQLGRPLPEFMGSFKNLQRYHNLSSTMLLFSGRALHQLGNLSKLRYLNLPQTQSNDDYLDISDSAAAQMESTDVSWLTRLGLLRFLDMIRLN